MSSEYRHLSQHGADCRQQGRPMSSSTRFPLDPRYLCSYCLASSRPLEAPRLRLPTLKRWAFKGKKGEGIGKEIYPRMTDI